MVKNSSLRYQAAQRAVLYSSKQLEGNDTHKTTSQTHKIDKWPCPLLWER